MKAPKYTISASPSIFRSWQTITSAWALIAQLPRAPSDHSRMIPGTDKLTRSFTLFVGLFPHVQACQLRLKKQGKDPLAATSKAAVEADVSTEKITITGDMFGINDENLARALADQVLDVTLATVNPI